MRVRSLGAILGLLAAVGCGAAWAQGTPATPSDASGIKLAYKFQPGAVYHYHMTTTGSMNLDMSKLGLPGGGGVPPAMPMELTMALDLTQTVKSVDPDGSATIEQSVQGLDTTMKVMGMNFAGGLKDGKLAYTMNGQPFAPPGMPAGNPFAGTTFEMHVAPSGRVLQTKTDLNEALKQATGGKDVTQMFGLGGMQGIGMLALPEHPVKVGDQWEDKSTVAMPMLMPGAPGATGSKVDLKRQNTLKAIEQKDGHPVAVIETKVDLAMPETKIPLPAQGAQPGPSSMTIEKMTQSVTGTNRFDAVDGALQAGEYTAKIATQMKMPLPAPAAAAPHPAGGTMGMDGTFHLKLDLQH